MSELDAPEQKEQPPPYIIFVVVSLFFLTGLLGFLICHLLKKKGYRCRTIGELDNEEEDEEKLGGNADDSDEHQDTVEQILKCIIENEANMEAFTEMLGNHNICVRHDPRLRKESIACIPSHHHTVHSGTDLNSCHLCAQARTKKGRRQSRTPRFKQRPGEQTVFSVGRFRVTHHDKKLQGAPLVSAGYQLDQSQDSEDKKGSEYNLRNMFKDVRPPLDTSNGIAPIVEKRRKSVTIFGLRRSSDPAGSKVAQGTGKETGDEMFAVQKRSAVLEELSQIDNAADPPGHSTKPKTPHLPGKKANTTETVNSLPETKNQFQIFSPVTEGGSNQSSTSATCMNPVNKNSLGSNVASVPSSLPISSAISSAQALMTEKHRDVDLILPNKDIDDPGPLQTSTPIAPIQGAISDPSKCYPIGVFAVIQTPPDLRSSTHMESSNSLALISLGSSPLSASQINAVSSLSLSNTPPIIPNPVISPENTPSEGARGLSTHHIQSPSFSSSNEQEQEGIGLPEAQKKSEINKTATLKTAKCSPVDGDLEATASSSQPYLSRDTPVSPSSPVITCNITIVKSSTNSKREFSVVPMVEDEVSTLTKDQSFDASEPGVDSKELQTVLDERQPESQYGEDRSTMRHKKGDSVEREHIA